MKQKLFQAILCVPLLALLAIDQSPAAQPNPPIRRNHFKVYEITGPKGDLVVVDKPVELRGQFDQHFKPATLTRLTHLANPVEKTTQDGKVSPIISHHLHYTWYELKQDEEEPKRTVKFRNQFGVQKWVIGDAKFLLVPAEKIEPGSRYVPNVNHYKCYEVVDPIGKTPQNSLVLVDQFGEQKLDLGKPLLFCVPVIKVVDGKHYPIKVKRPHFAVYRLGAERIVDVRDQFGERKELTVRKPLMLCVPTIKLGWSKN